MRTFQKYLGGIKTWLPWFGVDQTKDVLRVVLKGDSRMQIEAVLDQSAHEDISAVTGEAFKVVGAVYQYGNKGHVVHCKVVDGKIRMYIDNPGGGDGLPVEEEDVVVELFPKAA